MKKLMVGLIVVLIFSPLITSAATLEELQAQIAALMAQIAALQQGIQPHTPAASCPNLTRNLSRGMRGADVTELQNFLIQQGHLESGNNTGFYGALTEASVKKFQCAKMSICSGSPASNGYGAVGPRTRALIQKCAFATSTASYAQGSYTPSTYAQASYGTYAQATYTANTYAQATYVPPTYAQASYESPVSYLQYTAADAWQQYRATHRDQLYIYQGDLSKMGKNVEEIARALKPFDHIVLTNAFESAPTWVNGTCVVGTFRDPNGKNVGDLIELLRSQNGQVKIYGYVSSTADNPHSHGCWNATSTSQNYICPNGVCADFVKWVNAWRSYETSAARKLDGVFIDLFNLVYANSSTLGNIVSYAHDVKNAAGEPYKVIANLTNNKPAYYYAKPGTTMVLSDNPINVAKSFLRSGDIILAEGLSLKAGKIQNDNAAVYGLLTAAYGEKGINWMVIENEVAYVPPHSGLNCSIFGAGAGTAQHEGCADTLDYAWLEAPNACSLPNGNWTYDTFRQYAGSGGLAFVYSEGALGSFSGKIPFCPNNNWLGQ